MFINTKILVDLQVDGQQLTTRRKEEEVGRSQLELGLGSDVEFLEVLHRTERCFASLSWSEGSRMEQSSASSWLG